VTFLRDRFGEDKLRRMDIPPPPADVLVVETSCGVTEFPLGEVRWMIQKACTECPDMTSEFADLSVGMYEGQPGWNTLIVRTSKGKALVEYARSENRITCDPFPAENLEHLTTAATKKRQRNHRKVLEDVTHQS
jgi:coenzyme F420 hydrogenase subunit beta